MLNLILVISSGVLATLSMMFVMELITRSQLANADMVRAIGSIFTGRYENSLKLGLVLHIISGIIFAVIYYSIFDYFLINYEILAPVLGLLVGFFHGMVVSLSLVNVIAKYHPLKQFQETGLYMAIAHIIGHMVYGLSVGVMFSVFS